MRIEQAYKYKNNDIVYVGGSITKNVTILETLNILCADEGYELWRKNSDEYIGTSVWLQSGDAQRNYTEKLIQEVDDGNNN